MCHITSDLSTVFYQALIGLSSMFQAGKSSILTAIVVGLGARASQTNRSDGNIHSLIKYGCAYVSLIFRLDQFREVLADHVMNAGLRQSGLPYITKELKRTSLIVMANASLSSGAL